MNRSTKGEPSVVVTRRRLIAGAASVAGSSMLSTTVGGCSLGSSSTDPVEPPAPPTPSGKVRVDIAAVNDSELAALDRVLDAISEPDLDISRHRLAIDAKRTGPATDIASLLGGKSTGKPLATYRWGLFYMIGELAAEDLTTLEDLLSLQEDTAGTDGAGLGVFTDPLTLSAHLTVFEIVNIALNGPGFAEATMAGEVDLTDDRLEQTLVVAQSIGVLPATANSLIDGEIRSLVGPQYLAGEFDELGADQEALGFVGFPRLDANVEVGHMGLHRSFELLADSETATYVAERLSSDQAAETFSSDMVATGTWFEASAMGRDLLTTTADEAEDADRRDDADAVVTPLAVGAPTQWTDALTALVEDYSENPLGLDSGRVELAAVQNEVFT